MTRILGISAFYHDSAACLLSDDTIVAALQEERFTRKKQDSSFPARAIANCLRLGQCSVSEVDYVVFYEKTFSKFERLLETYSRHCPRGIRSYLKAVPLWITEKLWIKDRIRKELNYEGPILFGDHHESHAASAFYPSPFEQAAILTIDGVGEWTTTALGTGHKTELKLFQEIRFPSSLGLLYSTFTYYLGFRVNSDEYKVMGLAPYGTPRYEDVIRQNLIEIRDDGSFQLNPEYFDYEVGLKMASKRLEKLLGGPPRRSERSLEQRHKDLAASIQKVTEEAVLAMARYLHRKTGLPNLCLAGGVALNCVANGRLLREGPFQSLWIQPASGDAGGALGAALALRYRYPAKTPRQQRTSRVRRQSALLGTSYSASEIERFLRRESAVFHQLPAAEIERLTAQALSEGAVVGWFQGRMEFGPRALGNRSILADPRNPEMLQQVNLRIKFRESFRPFAPAVLKERAQEFFELPVESPYMLLVAQVRPEKRERIPAVTHVDGSARIQTVSLPDSPGFYRLLKAFEKITNCPVLLNTSFNVRNEPIVESPEQAYRCFMRTGMDLLVMENCLLWKKEQPDGL